jgi:hypothetical protein
MSLRKVVRNFGSALQYDGTTTHVTLPITSGLPLAQSATTSFTIASLIRLGTLTVNPATIYAEGNTSTSEQFYQLGIAVISGYPSLVVKWRDNGGGWAQNALISARAIHPSIWTPICITYASGKCHVYIDGTEDPNSIAGSFNYGTSHTMNFNTATVGALIRNSTSNYATGVQSEVMLFNRTLSATEAAAHAAFYTPSANGLLSSVGLIGHYVFNEGSGSSITDHSGNGNNGTVHGTSNWSTTTPMKSRTYLNNS